MASEPIGITMPGGANEVGVTLEPTAASDTIALGLTLETDGTVTMRIRAGFAKASTLGDIMESGLTTDRDSERQLGTDTATAFPADFNKVACIAADCSSRANAPYPGVSKTGFYAPPAACSSFSTSLSSRSARGLPSHFFLMMPFWSIR